MSTADRLNEVEFINLGVVRDRQRFPVDGFVRSVFGRKYGVKKRFGRHAIFEIGAGVDPVRDVAGPAVDKRDDRLNLLQDTSVDVH